MTTVASSRPQVKTKAPFPLPEVPPNLYEGKVENFQRDYQLSLREIADALPSVPTAILNLDRAAYIEFLSETLPYHMEISSAFVHKKKIEMFISHQLLNITKDSIFLDAAGGGYSYAGTLRCKAAYLQDMEIRHTVKKRVGPNVQYIEASISSIPLPDESVDAIACHHSIEHFQGNADMDFIREAQRILRPGGLLVIVPIFISRVHLEMTNRADFSNWSVPAEKRIVDPAATLPGRFSGHFARVYDCATFQDRILSQVDPKACKVEILEICLDGRSFPDPADYRKNPISNFNYPYRALKVTRR